MYFSGRLSVDPSQLTNIKTEKPTKAFKRMLYFMTAGAISDRYEEETFAAISILQQLNTVFRELNITNITSLAHDGEYFFLDTEGKKDDLKDAFDNYQLKVDSTMSANFEKINLILEHQTGNFKYFIEIDINRTHKVGAYPIQIKVNGLVRDFKSSTREEAQEKIQNLFSSQDKYNVFRDDLQKEFEEFIDKIESKVKESIDVDNIKKSFKRRMIIPKKRYDSASDIDIEFDNNADEPINHGYYEANAFLLYAMVWSDMAHANSIFIQDVDLVSSAGDHIGAIGQQGIDASNDAIFSSDTVYDDRLSDTALNSQEGFSDESETDWFGSSSSDSSSDSWFSSSSGDDSSSSGSSCSSCSSCGGGCGGG